QRAAGDARRDHPQRVLGAEPGLALGTSSSREPAAGG
ncbi:hypothetical protein ACG3RS_14055, partial [Pseudomonas aeruginosa]